MRQIAVVAALVAISLAVAQDQQIASSRSWEDWQPPVVQMPEPNAYDKYQIAFALLEGFEAPDQDASEQDLRASLAGFEPAHRALLEAQVGECRFPPLTGPDQTFPELASIRNAARFMVTRAKVLALGGQMAQAAMDCIACVRIGGAAATNGTLIGGLVSIACEAVGLRQLEEIIPALQPAECRMAIEALQAAEAERVTLPVVLQGELIYGKMMMKLQFRGIKSPDEDQDQFTALTPEQREEALRQWEETLRELGVVTWNPDDSWFKHEQWFGLLTEETAKPYWQREEVPLPGDPLVATMANVVARTLVQFAIADAKLRLALCHLAAQGYMVAQEGPPENLDALVPKYLPSVPDDPFRDATISSTTLDDEFVIYSIGPDMVDDGGTAIEGPASEDSKGDMMVAL